MPSFPALYVICDRDVCDRAGWALTDFAAACVEGGARLLQVRDKRASSAGLLETVQAVLERVRSTFRCNASSRPQSLVRSDVRNRVPSAPPEAGPSDCPMGQSLGHGQKSHV